MFKLLLLFTLFVTISLGNKIPKFEIHYDEDYTHEDEDQQNEHTTTTKGGSVKKEEEKVLHDFGENKHHIESKGNELSDGDYDGDYSGRFNYGYSDEEEISSDDGDSDSLPRHLQSQIPPSTPGVSLHALHNFGGQELFFDGNSLSLPKSIKINSHRIKGGFNWSIYPKSNYTGNPTCLMADQHHQSTNGHVQLIVGSIRRGCWCNDTINTVTPKPRTVNLLSGVGIWSGKNGEGDYTYTDGVETRFPYSIRMSSFQLIGKWIPWTLFSNTDLTGDGHCLLGSESTTTEKRNNYYYTNIPTPITVSSIIQTCTAKSSFQFTPGIDSNTKGRDGGGGRGRDGDDDRGGSGRDDDGGTMKKDKSETEFGFDENETIDKEIYEKGESGAKKGTNKSLSIHHLKNIFLFIPFFLHFFLF